MSAPPDTLYVHVEVVPPPGLTDCNQEQDFTMGLLRGTAAETTEGVGADGTRKRYTMTWARVNTNNAHFEGADTPPFRSQAAAPRSPGFPALLLIFGLRLGGGPGRRLRGDRHGGHCYFPGIAHVLQIIAGGRPKVEHLL